MDTFGSFRTIDMSSSEHHDYYETQDPGCDRADPPDGTLYSIKELSELVGLQRSTTSYLLGLGLGSPVTVMENRRQVRKISEADLSLFRRAQALLEAGTTPRQVVRLLGPAVAPAELFGPDLLTATEFHVIRRRQGFDSEQPGVPQTLEAIGAELGIAKQTVHEIQRNADRKLERAFLTYRARVDAAGEPKRVDPWIPDDDTVRRMIGLREDLQRAYGPPPRSTELPTDD